MFIVAQVTDKSCGHIHRTIPLTVYIYMRVEDVWIITQCTCTAASYQTFNKPLHSLTIIPLVPIALPLYIAQGIIMCALAISNYLL